MNRNDMQSALPDVESALQLDGLEKPVVIYRDQWGIPHIRAETVRDMFFAQGFATAQDRLWHMDYDRHRALGRWAEWIGSEGVESDVLLRAAGMGRTAKLDVEASADEARGMIDSYTAGVNAFVETTDSLPIEYAILGTTPERWESWHCLTVYKMRNTLLGTYEGKLYRSRMAASGDAPGFAKIMRGYPRGHLLTVPPGDEFEGRRLDGLDELRRLLDDIEAVNGNANANLWRSLYGHESGSNAWSISGEFTASGLPLVAGDSHRALDTPSVYYQVHLSCPEFSVMGSSVPGVPGALHFCHNEHVAWGMTYGAADTQDLFIERFREAADGGREYEFKGEWRAAQVLEETIAVDAGDDVDLKVTVTHHGPVIAGDPASGWGIAISDPGLIEGTPWPDAALDAMRSRSVEELHHAFEKWTDRVNNYAVADVHGHFGYLHEGRIPVRNESNGWRAVPGWTGEYEWRGYIPHDELPRAINPEVGYALTCNQRVRDESYRYFVGLAFAAGFRARRVQSRILELTRNETKPSDMARIHGDRISQPARIFTEALLKAAPSEDGCAGEALALLRQWDYRMDRELVQPTIYAELRTEVTAEVAGYLFADQAPALLSDDAGAVAHERLLALEIMLALESGDTSLLPKGTDWSQLMRERFAVAVARLRGRLGEDVASWRWRAVHRTRPRHPLSARYSQHAAHLDPPSVPVHGDGDTPLAGNYLHGTYDASHISVNRYIHDPSDWSNSKWIVPLGASGHPASPHYADQAQMWADVEYIPQLWDWAEIEEEAETVQLLEPR